MTLTSMITIIAALLLSTLIRGNVAVAQSHTKTMPLAGIQSTPIFQLHVPFVSIILTRLLYVHPRALERRPTDLPTAS
jgi:hypothetical protein